MLRSGTPDDHAAVAEVWRASRAATGQRPSAQALQDLIASLDEGLLLVATDGESVLGAAHATTRTTLDYQLVVVHPDARGQGLGTALVEALADLGWEAGLRTAEAWCADPGFYEACGFDRSDERDGLTHVTAELEAPLRDVVVSGEIRLGQFLKRAELVETGSEAKALIADSQVTVNDEVETRRGRQLDDGDVVSTGNGSARVVLNG